MTSSSRRAAAARSSSPPHARARAAWTSTGTPFEPRGLKHRPDGTIRVVPIPPVLVRMLRQHLHAFGTAPDGRPFRGTRGGMLSESVYGRAGHAARQAALGPDLAATALARCPYDLRHAALSLWLNASGTPAEVAARAGNSARVLHEVYLHCTDGQDDAVSQRIEDALDTGTGITHASPHTKASGYTHRRHHPRPCPLTCIAAVTQVVPRWPHLRFAACFTVPPCPDCCRFLRAGGRVRGREAPAERRRRRP